MLLIIKVRLTSPLLGEMKPDDRRVRRFKRAAGHNLHVHEHRWRDAFQLSAKQLQLSPPAQAFQPPAFLVPASIHLYERHIHGRREAFESMRKGTILNFDCILRDDLAKAPTLTQFQQVMTVMGRHFGISQFGNKFGFGRFELLEVLPATALWAGQAE